jgi:fructuronate reductase
MDGSQKLPQRLLGTISDRLRAGAPIERLSLTLAAWMIYAQGKDFAGKPIVVQDPLAAEFAAIDPERLVEGYLSLERIFPRELAGSGVFREAVERKVELLKMVGVAEAVRMVA